MTWTATPPTTVAILGSCVTRDVFNSRFVPGYAEVFSSVAYAGQTSLISLMDGHAQVPNISDLDDAAQIEVVKEFNRQFLIDVRVLQPDYLILDFFADVHFGCSEWNGKMVTRNRWKLLKSKAYIESSPHAEYPPGSDDYVEMWSLALNRFLKFVRDESPRTKIVLHQARNVAEMVNSDGTTVPFGSTKDATRMNRWWKQLDDIAVSMGVERVINVFDEDTRTSESHPWGSFYVHYSPDYNQRFFAALVRVALTDARADAKLFGRVPTFRRRRSI